MVTQDAAVVRHCPDPDSACPRADSGVGVRDHSAAVCTGLAERMASRPASA
jgi:hypothetical protein